MTQRASIIEVSAETSYEMLERFRALGCAFKPSEHGLEFILPEGTTTESGIQLNTSFSEFYLHILPNGTKLSECRHTAITKHEREYTGSSIGIVTPPAERAARSM